EVRDKHGWQRFALGKARLQGGIGRLGIRIASKRNRHILLFPYIFEIEEIVSAVVHVENLKRATVHARQSGPIPLGHFALTLIPIPCRKSFLIPSRRDKRPLDHSIWPLNG